MQSNMMKRTKMIDKSESLAESWDPFTVVVLHVKDLRIKLRAPLVGLRLWLKRQWLWLCR
jgi:hypothetical protein